MSSEKKGLAKNILSLGVVQVANYVLPLIAIPIISRIIGPEKYGVINFGAAFIAYFNLLIAYGFDLTATRRIARDPENEQNRNNIFSEVFYTQCLLFVFATTVFSILIITVPELRAEQTVFVFSFLFCIGTLFTQNWLFQAMQDLSKVALFNLISKLLFTVIILLVVQREEDYIWQPLLFSVIQIIVGLLSFIWAIKKYRLKFIKVPITKCLQLLVKEKTVFFSMAVISLYTSTNIFILGLYQSPEQVGFYTAGQRLIMVAQSVLTIPLAQALYPFIGKAFGESQEKGIQMAQKVVPLLTIFTGLAAIVMFIIGPYIIILFYGHKFDAAIPVFQILAVVPFIVSLSNVFGVQIMLNLQLDKQFFRITACGAILSISLNMLMIKQWGFIGTAMNWLVTEVFITVTMFIVLRHKGLHPINFNYFKPSVLSEYLHPIKRKLFVR